MQILLFSTDLVKWNADRMQVTYTGNMLYKDSVFTESFDVDLTNISKSIENFVFSMKKYVVENYEVNEEQVDVRDSKMLTDSLKKLFTKTSKELSQSKNKSGKRGSITRYNLFYLKESELAKLNDDEKFLAYIDIIDRKAQKEQFNQVASYISEALKLKPNNEKILFYQAKYLLSTNKTDEAAKYFESYLENNPNNVEILTELAGIYTGAKDFKKAENTFSRILKLEPKNMNALVAKAQIKYFRKQKYKSELNKIKELDSEWLKEYLKKNWDYKLSDTKEDLNPRQASELLGFSNPIEIARMVIKNEIPAFYHAKSARMMFSREELEAWIEILNEYELNEFNLELNS
jgi:tetratricopeptide (TPR) repeat protein